MTLFRITGYILILLGLWWLWRPARLQRKFGKKIKRSTRFFLFLIFIYLGSLFIYAVKNSHSMFSKLLALIGFLILLKILTLINKKAREKLLGILKEAPIGFWRIVSVIQILIGLLLQFVKK